MKIVYEKEFQEVRQLIHNRRVIPKKQEKESIAWYNSLETSLLPLLNHLWKKNILIVSFKISSFKLISCFLSLILLSDRTNCSSMLWLIFFFHLVLLIFVVTLWKTCKIKLFLPWFTCLSHSKDFERGLGNILFALGKQLLALVIEIYLLSGIPTA